MWRDVRDALLFQPDPDQGHVVYGMFHIVQNLPVIISGQSKLVLFPVSMLADEQYRFVGPVHASGNGFHLVERKSDLPFDPDVAGTEFIIHDSGIVSILEALEHLEDMPDMLPDRGPVQS
jgi:hypothetical protein